MERPHLCPQFKCNRESVNQKSKVTSNTDGRCAYLTECVRRPSKGDDLEVTPWKYMVDDVCSTANKPEGDNICRTAAQRAQSVHIEAASFHALEIKLIAHFLLVGR